MENFKKKGVGDRKFQFTTGDLGSVSKISVSSSAFSKEMNIRPTGLDIVWQTKSYTPPFYKGKALYTYQSLVDFVAMPSFMTSSGAMIDPKTLVYKWTRNGSVLGDSSGYGKNVFSTSGGVLAKPLQVEVEASTIDGSMRAKKVLNCKAHNQRYFCMKTIRYTEYCIIKLLDHSLILNQKKYLCLLRRIFLM